jgi:hypothetical protein
MRPAAAIQPYHKETLGQLVGIRCRAPVLSRPEKNWWVEIKEVIFINEYSAAARIDATHRKFGNARWVSVADLRWNGTDEPLLLAMHKARCEAKAASPQTLGTGCKSPSALPPPASKGPLPGQ